MTKHTYLHHKVDGTTEEVSSKRVLTLKQLQKLVGGHIEQVWVGKPYASRLLMINEDGLALGLLSNPKYPQVVGDIVEGTYGSGGEFEGV